MIVGMTRVRNESLIIEDTIRHFLGFCDRIYLYDDASTDDTVAKATAAGEGRVNVLEGWTWSSDRPREEGRHRQMLFQYIQESHRGTDPWVLCFDADERLFGTLPDLHDMVRAYRLRLFDGYLHKRCQQPYSGGKLLELDRMWGPEYREILMLFRLSCVQQFTHREPQLRTHISLAQDCAVKHFGKCLSVEHWEETCDYYNHNSWTPQRRAKWQARKGKAIHELSDFNRPLLKWQTLVNSPQLWHRI